MGAHQLPFPGGKSPGEAAPHPTARTLRSMLPGQCQVKLPRSIPLTCSFPTCTHLWERKEEKTPNLPGRSQACSYLAQSCSCG